MHLDGLRNEQHGLILFGLMLLADAVAIYSLRDYEPKKNAA
jgi:hypothetical protein